MSQGTAELMLRPLTEDGLLAIETSRMALPLTDKSERVFYDILDGCSAEQIQDEHSMTRKQLDGVGRAVLHDLDARTWSEAARIAIELGLVAVKPSHQTLALPSVKMQRFQTLRVRGLKRVDICRVEEMKPLSALTLEQNLDAYLGVSHSAFKPDAAATYEWYARGYDSVPSGVTLRLERLYRLQNMRRFLHSMYSDQGLDRLPDELTIKMLKHIGPILISAGIKETSTLYERTEQFLRTGSSWAEIAKANGVDADSTTKTVHRIRRALRAYADAAGILEQAGVTVELPVQPAPPLSTGVSNRKITPWSGARRRMPR